MSSRTWTLGEVFVIRHAGFPFDWIESLGVSDDFAHKVNELLALEARLVGAAAEAGKGQSERVRGELERGRPPPALGKAGAGYAELLAAWKEARAALEASFAEERASLRKKLHALASDEKIQEAVFLSSPDMFDNVWGRYVASPERPDNADARRVERQVYSYLQRFCAKNETTSFFGPMGYGEIEGEGEIEVVRPGPTARVRTFFAVWALQELARCIGREKALQPHLPLRKNPIFTWREERAECAALGLSVALGEDERKVLAALETPKSAAELGEALGVPAAVALKQALPLLKVAAVVRGLFFDTQDLEVFQSLVSAVSALPAGEVRDGWLARLSRLDALRDAFEKAGFPARREALSALEAAFTEITGVPARRGEGQMYSDRLVIYEEGASPFRLRFGKAFAERLAAALSPGLELSAAFGEQVWRSYRAEVRDRLGPGTAMDFLSYAAQLRPDGVSGSQFSPVEPIRLPEGGAGQTLGDVLPPSSEGGRFALPDVCLGGVSGEDGQPREVSVVLARVHHHLLIWNWLCTFYGDRPRLDRVARRWMEREPSAKNLTALAFSRRNKGFYSFPGPKLAYTPAEAVELGERGLSASELSVRVSEDGPDLFDGAGERRPLYLTLADFSTYPPFAALAHPLVWHAPLRSGGERTERLSLGGATYQRARWETELSSLKKLTGLDLFLQVQREAARRGWPRFLFGRVANERKPFFLDVRSPHAAELLRHLIAQDARVGFEEMLPGPDELWLRDERGRYTFELRMQAERWSAGRSPHPSVPTGSAA